MCELPDCGARACLGAVRCRSGAQSARAPHTGGRLAQTRRACSRACWGMRPPAWSRAWARAWRACRSATTSSPATRRALGWRCSRWIRGPARSCPAPRLAHALRCGHCGQLCGRRKACRCALQSPPGYGGPEVVDLVRGAAGFSMTLSDTGPPMLRQVHAAQLCACTATSHGRTCCCLASCAAS